MHCQGVCYPNRDRVVQRRNLGYKNIIIVKIFTPLRHNRLCIKYNPYSLHLWRLEFTFVSRQELRNEFILLFFPFIKFAFLREVT